jgi:cobalt-precorrin 5A hydrolase
MKTAVIALTQKGAELALKIGCVLDTDIYVRQRGDNVSFQKCIINGEIVLVHPFSSNFGNLVERVFHSYEGLVFIMACGIVVRSIAPYLESKGKDPAVVVMDEMGRHVISLLSGHLGGANELTTKVSAITGGIPVITTATDINNVIAFDVFARNNNCAIENICVLKYISSELVNGGKVGLYSDCDLRGVLPPNITRCEPGQKYQNTVVISNKTDISLKAEKTLILRPKNLILGIGCKKGKSREEIEKAVKAFLQKNHRSILSVRKVSSIDLKAREKGILEFCADKGIEFATFSAEAIRSIENEFKTSEFVKKVTGAGNIAETCAVLAGEKAGLVCSKTVYSGITLALAQEERSYCI